jgi:hypothetical protein
MRITESQLRKIVRNIIAEDLGPMAGGALKRSAEKAKTSLSDKKLDPKSLSVEPKKNQAVQGIAGVSIMSGGKEVAAVTLQLSGDDFQKHRDAVEKKASDLAKEVIKGL